MLLALTNLDLDAKEREAQDVVKRKLKSKRPEAVKVLGYIQGLRRSGVKPHELMIRRVPVIPPAFRPYAVAGDTFIPGDANEIYRDLLNLVGVHKKLESRLGAGAAGNRANIQDAVNAVYGFGDPTSPKTRERGVKGFLEKVTGVSPKHSYPQRRLLSRTVDYVGRSVIGLDPDMGMDEIGVPEEMAWKIFSPYIQSRLARSGMKAEEAVRSIKERSSIASKHLDAEMKERPVVYSRAPAWHKFSTMGAYARRVPGNAIMVNPYTTTGQGSDFDGDAVGVHVPSLPSAVDDVKNKLMASKQLFSIKDPDKVVPVPKQEAILGLRQAQTRLPKTTHTFPDEASALKAIKAGQVRLSDEVQIGVPAVMKI